MKPGDRVEVGGVVYEAAEDTGVGGCDGCAGNEIDGLCPLLPCCHPDDIAPMQLVFVRVEPC